MKSRVVFFILTASVYAASDRPVEYNRDVRPILSDKCFTCHGPDAAAKKIPFRLDREAAAKADLGGHFAIVEGDANTSTLVQRITSPKASLKMPPVYSGLKLTESEIETLRAWIEQGAKWQKHWSFIPPVRKPLPDLSPDEKAWARNPIDHFVLEQLRNSSLKPSAEASREKLIRRVSLDLTGLPPTPAEVDAFLKDTSPKAYEKVVDRLLASSRYGERMAARWLDAARYADTNGYQFDGERFMWRWRDWVIDAFNRNQPYDQFTVEQIAGDLLPHPALDQVIATGFNRNHRANTEDGIVAEEYAVEYVVDRVETTSTVFLGLTLGCARCHNHKYDPFSQKEFYQMFAYFDNVPEFGRAIKYGNSPPYVPAPTREQQAAAARLADRARAEQNRLNSKSEQIRIAQRKWEAGLASEKPAWWTPSRGLAAEFSFDDSPTLQGVDGPVRSTPGKFGQAASFEGGYLQGGKTAEFDIDDRFTLSTWVYADSEPDGSLVSRMKDDPKGKGYGLHLDRGKVHFNLTGVYESDAIRVETAGTIAPKQWHHVVATYDGSIAAQGVKIYIDGNPAEVKVLANNLYRPFRNAGKQFTEQFRIGAGWGKARRFHGMIDDVRVFNRVLSSEEISLISLGESVAEIAARPEAKRTQSERTAIRWWYLEHAAEPEIREMWSRLASLAREREALEVTFPTVMVMAENAVLKPTHLLVRGAYDKPGSEVQRGVPAVLPSLPTGVANNRLALAKWLVDSSNPLTARVAVNRYWQMYFGSGLVKTIEDFGVQGDWPSDPDLLDWLATEFVRTGWDVKAMQKLIVTSATYRQTSQASKELLQRDPDNRLLARGPRGRLAPEMVRDQALAAAGLLFEKVGGPSVKPYQPEGLWKEQAMQDMDYVQSHGPDLYRRSLYTFWKRTIPPPMMMNFDAAARESCVVRETRTNTPLQALNMMNDITFVEAARFIGQRMMTEGGNDPESRLRYGFRLLTARQPTAAELRVLTENLSYHRDYFASDQKRAEALLRMGETSANQKLDRTELAAYASVGSLLLNLDEVVTKQ